MIEDHEFKTSNDSYSMEYLVDTLESIADCLHDNDKNRALTKLYWAIRYGKEYIKNQEIGTHEKKTSHA